MSRWAPVSFTAVLDAHVLVPARVRDVLLTLAEADLYRPLWSERILDEVCRHLPDSMDGAARDRLLKAMAAAFPEAVVPVPTGLRFDELARINAKDQHVVQAAIFGHKTEPGARGDTATNVLKPAKIDTGYEIGVPLFINQGDFIRIDTRTGKYVERVKQS